MAANPSFASTPRAATAALTAANASRDGTGATVTLISGVAAGTKVEEIRITPRVTTTAGVVRIFLHDGTTFFLLEEIVIAARTLSSSVAALTVSSSYENLVLPSASWSIRVSTEKAEAMTVFAFGGDF